MDNFDLKKYLVENKVTANSKMLKEDLNSLNSLAEHYLTLLKVKYPKNLISLIAQYVADPANGTPAPKSESDLLDWAMKDIKWNASEEGMDIESIDKKYIQDLVAGVESMIPTTDPKMTEGYSANTSIDYDIIPQMEKDAPNDAYHDFINAHDRLALGLLDTGYSEKQINDFLVYTISTLSID